MKKPAIFFVAVVLLSALLCSGAAAQNSIRVYLDGVRLATSIDPVEQDGTTLVPFRSIFEALGLTVDWNPQTQTVSGQREGLDIQLKLGNTKAQVNGETKELSVAPKTLKDNTVVPLRFVAEAAGCQVEWNGGQRRVVIQTPGYVSPANAYQPITLQHTADKAYLEELYTVAGNGDYAQYWRLMGFPGDSTFAVYFKGTAGAQVVQVVDLRKLNPKLTIAWQYEGQTYKNTRAGLYQFFAQPSQLAAQTGIDVGLLTPEWFGKTFGALYDEWVKTQQYTTDGELLVGLFLQNEA